MSCVHEAISRNEADVCAKCGLVLESCVHEEISTNEAVVCAKCGLVLDQLYIYPTPTSSKQQEVPAPPDAELYEICHKLNTPFYSTIADKFKSLHHPHAPKKNFLMAAAIYSSLNSLGCPQDIQKICYLCEVSSKRLWKCMNKMSDVDDSFNYAFAEHFLQSFQLPYSVIKELQEQAENVPGTCSPKTVLASLCYNYLNKTGKKISLYKLAGQLGVSQMSCRRCLKSIKKENASTPSRQVLASRSRSRRPVRDSSSKSLAGGQNYR